jgi:hypothetical protein
MTSLLNVPVNAPAEIIQKELYKAFTSFNLSANELNDERKQINFQMVMELAEQYCITCSEAEVKSLFLTLLNKDHENATITADEFVKIMTHVMLRIFSEAEQIKTPNLTPRIVQPTKEFKKHPEPVPTIEGISSILSLLNPSRTYKVS